MTLTLDELTGSLYQEITTGTRPIQLYAIRPHLYRHASPTGSLTMQVWDASGNLIDTSETITISQIGSDTYWHGEQRFLISTELQANTVYRIALVAGGGYSYSASAFVSWCQDYDLRKVPSLTGGPAYLLELWEQQESWRRLG